VQAFLSVGIFGLTLAGVLTRPRGISEAWVASLGALLLLLLGLVPLSEAWEVTRQSGDVLLFLLFLMALSALVDTSGFFDWAATLAARAAKGSPHRLLIGVFLLGATITTLLSLDTTALLLTPLVWAVVARAKLPPRPYLFACAFVANIASSALPVANLTNLLAFNRLGVSTARYALIMAPVTVLSSLVALGVILYVFRRDIPETFDADAFPDPLDAVPHLPYFRITLVVLALTLVGYFAGPALHIPLWGIAALASLLLLGAGKWLGRVKARTIALRGVAWSVFPFVIGMFIVIRGVEDIGLATWLGRTLSALGGTSLLGTIFSSAFGTAVGANLVNNIPMLLLSLSALDGKGNGALYAAVLGCNLGPNITVVGSLATMLWRSVLQKRGLDITPGELARAGLMVTLPALFIACLTLWVMLMLFPTR
jgi:arsenical pump membrane protein